MLNGGWSFSGGFDRPPLLLPLPPPSEADIFNENRILTPPYVFINIYDLQSLLQGLFISDPPEGHKTSPPTYTLLIINASLFITKNRDFIFVTGVPSLCLAFNFPQNIAGEVAAF